MELEHVLPYYKNKLSLVAEPSYQQFEASAKANDPRFNNSVKYHFLELPAGLRYYLYLNDNLRLFANGFLVLGFPQKTNLNYKGLGYNANITFTTSLYAFALGAGINYKRIGAECRYYTKRSVYYQGGINIGHYQKVSLVTSFRIY